MGFADFLERVKARRLDDLSARAERAGAKGVEVARSIVPVRTGRLRDSIKFIWNRSTMTLTLYADAEYALMVNGRVDYMGPARAAMSQIFRGGTVDIQFATVPEKYQEKARLLTASSGHTIIGHRKSMKFRK